MAAYISFQPSDFFNTVLYTGTGVSQAITGVGFQPDISWLKDRTAVAYHYLFDSARGVGNAIFPNDTDEEAYNLDYMSAFNADGITVGTNSMVNGDTKSYTSWHWKAGTTSGIATDGSTTITPSAYSFDQTRGISIVKYVGNLTAGAKLAHGLGATPGMVMVKMTNAVKDWKVYHKNMDSTAPQDSALTLNTDGARVNELTYWNDTAPDSVNMTLGNSVQVNGSGDDYVAYCFTGKRGFSKFGSYVGNGNVDGSFVYTGFRPAFVMIKNIVTSNWFISDDKRPGANAPYNYTLLADTTAAEVTSGGNNIDILSNGFKARSTGSYTNGAGTEMTYMAFAEFPFVSSNSKAGTAR